MIGAINLFTIVGNKKKLKVKVYAGIGSSP